MQNTIICISLIALCAVAIPVTRTNPFKYHWSEFSKCTKTCGIGKMTRTKICDDPNSTTVQFCGYSMSYMCAMQPCNNPFEGVDFGTCSKKCDGGIRTRVVQGQELQTIECNTHRCNMDTSKCESDLVFVLDSSNSIGDYHFYNVRQFAIDIVNALTIGNKRTDVGVVSYSTKATVNIDINDHKNKAELNDLIWKLPFLAGETNTADALMKMRKMCKKNRRVGKKQIAIVLTDGLSNIDNHRTVKEAQLAKDDDIEIIVIAMGRFKSEKEGRAIASKDSYFGLKSVSAIMSITDKIVKATCIGPKTCTECAFPKCPTTCGYDGEVKGYHDCTWKDNGDKKFSHEFCGIKKCHTDACTTTTEATTTEPTTTTVATTTTEATTTTTPTKGGVDCSKCDFTNGIIWRPDVKNCHGYFVCEPTAHKGVYRVTRMSCGELFWNQDYHTCDYKPTGNCNPNADPITTIKINKSTAKPICPYETNPADNHQFRSKSVTEYQTCPAGLIFNDSPETCTCIRGADFTVEPCDSSMLLHFPYDKHLDDVTCNKAKSDQVGSGKVVLVDDAVRGKVAAFNGKGYLEVPFIRTYFAGNTVTEFSISLFFKATSVSTKGALVSNGDCKETSSFETGYSNGKLYQEGTTTDNNVVSTGIKSVTSGTWNHVAWVYDGATLKLYLNGAEVSSRALTGAITNNDVPMDVGARCGEFYHTGLIDEVQVYARALSAAEVLALSNQ